MVSSTNTTLLSHQEGQSSSYPAPICRSFGLRCLTGECFTGDLPRDVRGPVRGLRNARLWSCRSNRLMKMVLVYRRTAGDGGDDERGEGGGGGARLRGGGGREEGKKKHELLVPCLELQPFRLVSR